MSTAVWSSLFGAAVAGLLIAFAKGINPEPLDHAGTYVSSYGPLARGVMAFCAAAGAHATSVEVGRSGAFAPLTLLLGTVTVVSAWLTLTFVFSRIEFDSRNVRLFSPFRAVRAIPWGAITEIEYEYWSRWWVIGTVAHGTFRVSELLRGHEMIVGRARQIRDIRRRRPRLRDRILEPPLWE